MARKHVYPVCNPNVLEFTKDNSAQSDLDQFNIASYLFHTDGSWGQLLFGEANNEDWEIEGMSTGRGFFFIGYIRPSDSKWSLTSKPPSGLVICIGSKDKQNGTFDPFYARSRSRFYPSTGYTFIEADDMSGLGSTSFDEIFNPEKTKEEYHAKPHWITLMFDGTR